MKKLLIGIILLLVIVTPKVFTQNEKIMTVINIYQYPDYVPEPIKIVGLKYLGKEVENGQNFQATSDWVKHLSIRVKNVSGQKLKYVEVAVNFPRDLHGNPTLAQVSLWKGFNYMLSAEFPAEKVSIDPNEEVDLFVSDSAYEAFDEDLSKVCNLQQELFIR